MAIIDVLNYIIQLPLLFSFFYSKTICKLMIDRRRKERGRDLLTILILAGYMINFKSLWSNPLLLQKNHPTMKIREKNK